MPKKKTKVSTYTILNRWLFDGSASSKVPDDVIKDKSIGHMNLLYFFQCSHYGLVVSKLFNNWGLFSLDRVEVFNFLKQCVLLSGYRPPFIQRGPKKKSKFFDLLKLKYPYLKREEVFMLVDLIDVSEDKDAYYEMFGLYTPKKKKTTKVQRKEMLKEFKKLEQPNESTSLDDLMRNFSNVN